MKAKLIVMSHGQFAKEIVASAEMIVGPIQDVAIVCMDAQDGLAGTQAKLTSVINAYTDEPVLILADVFGGTPFNVALMVSKIRPNTMVISGLNLNMLIEYSVTQIDCLLELAQYLVRIGKQAIMIPEEENDDVEIG